MTRPITTGEIERLIIKTEQNVSQHTALVERLSDKGHNMTEAKKMLAVLTTALQNMYTYREQVLRIK